MTETLRQIVYISRAAPNCDDDEVRDIAHVSQVQNAARGVTGLLLYDGRRFIQAIEGPPDAVQDTIDRIYADKRHDDVQTATDRLVDRRQFGSWSMQSRRTPAGACAPSFLRKIMELMRNVDDAALQALFIGFTVMSRPSAKEQASA
jgi:hypothetical protein